MKTLLKRMLLTALAFVVAASASPQPGAPGSSGATSERIVPLPDLTPLLGVRAGPAAASGIRPGDVIVAVGHDEFKSLEEFEKLLAQRKKGERVPLPVRRGEGARYVPVELA